MTITVTLYGDSALLVEVDDVPAAHRLAALIEAERSVGDAPAAIDESVVGFGNVVVHLHPGMEAPEEVGSWLHDLVRRVPDPRPAGGSVKRVVIPVTFDGPDLGAVATGLGTTTGAVVEALCGVDLSVAFLGFAPGFPYLIGLPPELASVPRRATPRPAVAAGAVAVGGGFASVYPQATPGGWMLLGRTRVALFDPGRPPYALLGPGDTVRFVEDDPTHPGEPAPRGTASEGHPLPGPRPLLANRGPDFAEVVEPGLLSLIQDGGRRSSAGLGVPRAGPADPEAMRLANRLVGNPDGAAAVEVTAAGPTLRFAGQAHLAVVAAAPDAVDVRLDDRPVGSGAVLPVRAGQVVTIGRIRTGLRAYLAVSGGFAIPLEVGSRSSDMLCGLGPGPLRVGDRIDLGPPSRPRGRLVQPGLPDGIGRHREVRVLPGPHDLPPIQYQRLLSRRWTVGEASNRIGIRLMPEPEPRGEERDHLGTDAGTAPATQGIPSTGMVTGAVQVPPDGNPIVLMPDHATVGGYPVACCVIAADLAVLGQLAPGDTLGLTAVDRTAARIARERAERSLAERVTGWFPTVAGT